MKSIWAAAIAAGLLLAGPTVADAKARAHGPKPFRYHAPAKPKSHIVYKKCKTTACMKKHGGTTYPAREKN